MSGRQEGLWPRAARRSNVVGNPCRPTKKILEHRFCFKASVQQGFHGGTFGCFRYLEVQ